MITYYYKNNCRITCIVASKSKRKIDTRHYIPRFFLCPDEADKGFYLRRSYVLLQQLPIVVQQRRNRVLRQNIIADLFLHEWKLLRNPFLWQKLIQRYIMINFTNTWTMWNTDYPIHINITVEVGCKLNILYSSHTNIYIVTVKKIIDCLQAFLLRQFRYHLRLQGKLLFRCKYLHSMSKRFERTISSLIKFYIYKIYNSIGLDRPDIGKYYVMMAIKFGMTDLVLAIVVLWKLQNAITETADVLERSMLLIGKIFHPQDGTVIMFSIFSERRLEDLENLQRNRFLAFAQLS